MATWKHTCIFIPTGFCIQLDTFVAEWVGQEKLKPQSHPSPYQGGSLLTGLPWMYLVLSPNVVQDKNIFWLLWTIRPGFQKLFPCSLSPSPKITTKLMRWVAQVGIPKEIISDQGMNFMLRVLWGLCKMLHIKHLRTAVCYPQTDRMVEQFNKTLKGMLREAMQGNPKEWNQLLDPLLSVIRESPQASSGFSTFELVYGYQPWGLLHVVCEGWEKQRTMATRLPNHLIKVRDWLHNRLPRRICSKPRHNWKGPMIGGPRKGSLW